MDGAELAGQVVEAAMFPPGTDARRLLADLRHTAMWHPRYGPQWRRRVTKHSPIAFAMTYLPDRLYSAQTGYRVSFSPFHVDLHRAAKRWPNQRTASRIARVAPRGSGKTTWDFEILPLWALCHGHRRFALAFGDTLVRASGHLDDVREILTGRAPESDLILADYPHMRPQRGRNSATGVAMVGSDEMPAPAFYVTGMGAKNLGIKHGSVRPDLIIGDDLEPPEDAYTPEQKNKRLSLFLHTALPMNEQAVVILNGTSTMYGAIMHDVVRAAIGDPEAPSWVADEEFRPVYYPAIIDGPDGPRSLWPQRWSIEWLLAQQHKRAFAFNYLGQPPAPGGKLWYPGIWTYHRPARVLDRVISIDVAVTVSDTADYSAMAIGGWAPELNKVVIEYAAAWRITGRELRAKIWAAWEQNKSLDRVILEGNQGGDVWAQVLYPLPPGMTLDIYHSSVNKEVRLGMALDQYERDAVVHTQRLTEFEDQAVLYPDVDHDDLLDAVAALIADVQSRWVRAPR